MHVIYANWSHSNLAIQTQKTWLFGGQGGYLFPVILALFLLCILIVIHGIFSLAVFGCCGGREHDPCCVRYSAGYSLCSSYCYTMLLLLGRGWKVLRRWLADWNMEGFPTVGWNYTVKFHPKVWSATIPDVWWVVIVTPRIPGAVQMWVINIFNSPFWGPSALMAHSKKKKKKGSFDSTWFLHGMSSIFITEISKFMLLKVPPLLIPTKIG